jgi:hypothetical protein
VAYPATLQGGLIVGATLGAQGSGGPAALGGGRLLVHLGESASLDLAGAEGYAAGPGRQVGAIGVGARAWLGGPVYVRGGFLHHHEVPWASFRDEPARAVAGVGDAIVHRSGAEVGAGAALDLERWDPRLARLGLGLDLSLGWLPATEGPPIAVGAGAGLLVHAGRPR